MKCFLCFLLLSAMTFSFSFCSHHYVSKELSYREIERPSRLTNNSIWNNGDWRWNRTSQNYIHTEGRYMQPIRSRTFVNGYWKSNRRGSYWVNGRWN